MVRYRPFQAPMKFASMVSFTFSEESGSTKISAENFSILSVRAEAAEASTNTTDRRSAKRWIIRFVFGGLGACPAKRAFGEPAFTPAARTLQRTGFSR